MIIKKIIKIADINAVVTFIPAKGRKNMPIIFRKAEQHARGQYLSGRYFKELRKENIV
jgi:hypothetical protein